VGRLAAFALDGASDVADPHLVDHALEVAAEAAVEGACSRRRNADDGDVQEGGRVGAAAGRPETPTVR
jgi:hypothetical protein